MNKQLIVDAFSDKIYHLSKWSEITPEIISNNQHIKWSWGILSEKFNYKDIADFIHLPWIFWNINRNYGVESNHIVYEFLFETPDIITDEFVRNNMHLNWSSLFLTESTNAKINMEPIFDLCYPKLKPGKLYELVKEGRVSIEYLLKKPIMIMADHSFKVLELISRDQAMSNEFICDTLYGKLNYGINYNFDDIPKLRDKHMFTGYNSENISQYVDVDLNKLIDNYIRLDKEILMTNLNYDFPFIGATEEIKRMREMIKEYQKFGTERPKVYTLSFMSQHLPWEYICPRLKLQWDYTSMSLNKEFKLDYCKKYDIDARYLHKSLRIGLTEKFITENSYINNFAHTKGFSLKFIEKYKKCFQLHTLSLDLIKSEEDIEIYKRLMID